MALAAGALLALSLILAVTTDPPVKGWVFTLPAGAACLLVAVAAGRQAWGWLTSPRPVGPAAVLAADKQLGKSIMGTIGVALAIFGVLQTVNGDPDPAKIAEMFSATLCLGAPRGDVRLNSDQPSTDYTHEVVTVTVSIRVSAAAGEHYWIMSNSLGSTPMAVFAKEQLARQDTVAGAVSRHYLQIKSFDPTGARRIFLACAGTKKAQDLLEENQSRDPDPQYNIYRKALPPGAFIASTCISDPPIEGNMDIPPNGALC